LTIKLIHKFVLRFNWLRLKLFYFFRIYLNILPDKKRILIIKSDAIGDYIIFRNFLEEIVKSEKFKNHQLYLLTSTKLEPIVKQLDAALLEGIILFHADYLSSALHELNYYKKLKRYRFKYVIHPTYSPNNTTQYLIKYIAAKYKIGIDGDLINQSLDDKKNYGSYYTQLLQIDHYSHEFEKQKQFFKTVLEQPVSITKPTLPDFKSETLKKEILICPGAQHEYRIWPLASFAELITRLKKQFQNYNFTIVTGPGEDNLYHGIKQATKVELKQFKIDSLINLISVIKSSVLVICNDSSAAHISVACNTFNVCISNGNHFGRFVPYPSDMQVNQKVIFHPQVIKDLQTNTALEKYYGGSTLDITEIDVNSVYTMCENHLNQVSK
jgi:ADP-heptose:LPS heptosyltransferase